MARGHVRKRGRSTWTAYWYEDGRQRSKGGFPSEDAAWTHIHRTLAERSYGINVEPSELTVAGYLTLWLATKHDIRAGTRRTYHSRITNGILPYLGSVRVQDLTTTAIRSWIGDLIEEGRTPTYVRQTHTTLKAALEDAVEEGLVRRNPARSRAIRLPRDERAEIIVWDEREVQQFLAHIADHPRFALYRLLLAAQLRIGEAVALHWGDIDLAAGTMRVRRTFDYTTSGFTDPKTPAARRAIDLDAETIAALARHRERQVEELRRAPVPLVSDLVFPNRRGRPLHPYTINTQLGNLSRAAGVPALSPHGLRHTGATLLLLAGVPLHVVSRRLGHARVQITIDFYGHLLPESQREAAAELARVMDGQ